AHRTHGGADPAVGLLALPVGDLQSLGPPEALDPLVVHDPARLAGGLRSTTPPPPGAVLGEGPEEPAQFGLLVGDHRWIEALGGSVLADHPARPALRDPEPPAQHLHSCASPVRGQKFPSASSLSIALSSSASARSFFRRAFSPSSSFRRLASLAFMPPYWATQRCHVESAICRCRQTWSSSVPPARSLLPSASFRMIWSGVCRRRFVMVSVLLPHLGATDSHNTWTTTRGSAHPLFARPGRD